MAKIPRKRTRQVATCQAAITTTVLAVADAAARGQGINLETTFPGGRMQVMIGEITITRSSVEAPATPRKEGDPPNHG